MNKPWLQHYPANIPPVLPDFPYRSLADLLTESFARFADRPLLEFMGTTLTYRAVEEGSKAFAAYLQSLGLEKGDRVALMMPNVPQYPIAVAGVVRAGMIVVNTNPLYTPRELQHQLSDSGAKAIVILENMASTFEACRAATPVRHVVLASIGDMLPKAKGLLVNFVLRRVKKMVPAFRLPDAVRWSKALSLGRSATFNPAQATLGDIAVLQYTGGTTGVSKGAMLTHSNIIANVLQSELWNSSATALIPAGEQPVSVCALPIYHIFGFTVIMMLSIRQGGSLILIPNPRDIPGLIATLARQRFHLFPAVNTLFGAIARHPDCARVDWSSLKLSLGGGMAVQPATAALWLEKTGSAICEGYGLSETSPSASCNPTDSKVYSGTIGMPLPSTEFKIVGEDGEGLSPGETGEIAIRGPQVMAGYWQRPEETARATTPDGFFKTGDIGVMDPDGRFKIVDRKKDMINVSGFNVYPNEIEEVVTRMPGVIEAAAIAVPDEMSGEAVKLFVVAGAPEVTEEAVKAFCRENLTGYKRPKHIVFRGELPKTNVGKVLRRALRD